MVARLTRSLATLADPISFDHGLALEEQLVARVADARHHVTAALWRVEQCLVMPAKFGDLPGFDVLKVESRARGWPICLRRTGGDLTPQHSGFFNFSYAFRTRSKGKGNVADAYRFLCAPLLDWIAVRFSKKPMLGATAGSFCDGDFNINVDGRKVAGTAQRWRVASPSGASGEGFIVLGHAVVFASGPIEPCVEIVNWFRDRTGTAPFVRTDSHTTLLAGKFPEKEGQRGCEELMHSFGKHLQNSELHGAIHFEQ